MRRVSGLSWGGLPGRLVAVGAGTLQLSLGVLGVGLKPGAGLLCRRDDTTALIHATSRGLPRAVNNLAIQALIAAYAGRKAIADETSARTAAAEVTAD